MTLLAFLVIAGIGFLMVVAVFVAFTPRKK
jgi:hypothetical protein